MDTQNTDVTKVLLVGYSGANNTGAEALLLADIEDMRAVFGSNGRITIPTINPANLRRYVQEGPDLRIAPMPTVFFAALRTFVRESDLVFLVDLVFLDLAQVLAPSGAHLQHIKRIRLPSFKRRQSATRLFLLSWVGGWMFPLDQKDLAGGRQST